ncbi:MAG: TPM domain-containing protein [bacterium]
MRKILLIASLFLVCFSAAAFEVPELKARVNDYAGVLSQDTKNGLETLLKDYQDKTGNQIVVLTVASYEDAGTIEQYGLAVADKWKIGQKKEDNGLILIVSTKERKVRFEVGYGLEGKLPDVVAFRIIREIIVPAFREGNYDQGVAAGVVSAINNIGGYDVKSAGGTVATSSVQTNTRRSAGFVKLIGLLIFFSISIIFRFIFGFTGAGRRGRGTGGVFFGGFGGGSGFGGGGFGGGGGGFGGGGASGGW